MRLAMLLAVGLASISLCFSSSVTGAIRNDLSSLKMIPAEVSTKSGLGISHRSVDLEPEDEEFDGFIVPPPPPFKGGQGFPRIDI
jgi:hypothetical protein